MNYIRVENGSIVEQACGSDVEYYLSQGFEQTERKIVTGYDGKMYFEDECPQVPRILEIEKELEEIDKNFKLASQQPIEFENNFYKFEWTSFYQSLLGLDVSLFPIKVWDISGLEENAAMMTKEKLQTLQNLLVSYQEPAFQERKEKISTLLSEKNTLR